MPVARLSREGSCHFLGLPTLPCALTRGEEGELRDHPARWRLLFLQRARQ